jgi:hypothetical protein
MKLILDVSLKSVVEAVDNPDRQQQRLVSIYANRQWARIDISNVPSLYYGIKKTGDKYTLFAKTKHEFRFDSILAVYESVLAFLSYIATRTKSALNGDSYDLENIKRLVLYYETLTRDSLFKGEVVEDVLVVSINRIRAAILGADSHTAQQVILGRINHPPNQGQAERRRQEPLQGEPAGEAVPLEQELEGYPFKGQEEGR